MENPYADPDGGPKDGQTIEWSRWQDDAERTRRAGLTEIQRQAEDAIRKPIQRRMRSESDLS